MAADATFIERINSILPLINAPNLADFAAYQEQSERDQPSGYAGLDVGGRIGSARLPPSIQQSVDRNTVNGYAGLDGAGRMALANLPTTLELAANKNAANGYCGLDAGAQVPLARLPATSQLVAERGLANGYESLGATSLAQHLPTGLLEHTSNKNTANGYCGLDAAARPLDSHFSAAAERAANKAQAAGFCPLDGSERVPLVHIPAGVEGSANKAQASGYASLNGSSLVPAAQLPSGAGGALVSLTDVSVTAPAPGERLVYDTGLWRAESSGGSSGVTFYSFADVTAPYKTAMACVSSDRKKLYLTHTQEWVNSADMSTSSNRRFYAVDFFDGTYRQNPAATIVKSFLIGASVYVLFSDDYLWSFGYNGYGQLLTTSGTTDVNYPIFKANVKNVWMTQNFIIQSNGIFLNNNNVNIQVKGSADNGQLGTGSTATQTTFATLPTPTFAPANVLDIWMFGSYTATTFLQTSDLKIWATGYNLNGQCGNGSTSNLLSFTDVTANWGGASGTVVNIVGGFIDSGGSGGFTVMHKRVSGVDVLMAAGYGLFTGTLASGTGNISTPLVISTSFLAPTETIVKISLAGSGILSGRVFVLGSLGNLYFFGKNLTVSGNSVVPSLATTGVVDIFNSGCCGWSGLSTNSPVFISKNDGLYVAGNNNNNLPLRSNAAAAAFTLCSFKPVNAGATIRDVRSIGDSTAPWTTFVLDSDGHLYISGTGGSYFFKLYQADANVTLRQPVAISKNIF